MFEGETPPPQPHRHNLVEKTKTAIRRLTRETKSAIEPEPKDKARETLTAISIALREHRPKVPFPKHLHLEALGKEYVTWRRYDGEQLARNSRYNIHLIPNVLYEKGQFKIGSGNNEGSKRTLSLPLETLKDGQIAIFIHPHEFVGSSPSRTRELMQATKTPYETSLWSNFHHKKPFEYNPADWKPDGNSAKVIMRIGEKAFLGEVIYDGLAGFRELDVDKGNMLIDSSLFGSGDAGSSTRQAEEVFFEQFAQFHILEGGTTQKQTKIKEVRQPELRPVNETE